VLSPYHSENLNVDYVRGRLVGIGGQAGCNLA
jgi:hypothetical protein